MASTGRKTRRDGRPRRRSRHRRLARLALFCVVLTPFATRPALIGGDEVHYALASWSLAFDRDLALDDQYDAVARGSSPAAGRKQAGKRLDRHLIPKPSGEAFSHPPGLPLLAAPLLWGLARVGAAAALPDLALGLLSGLATFAGVLALIGLLGRWLGDARAGAWLAVLLYLGSPLWFYGRTFFTEPYLWAFLVLACAACTAGRCLLGGVLLGLAVAVKGPALLPVAAILAGVALLRGRRCLLRAAVGPAMALGALAARNLLLYGGGVLDAPQAFKYGSVVAGAIGLLVDGSHGLLWFAPVALLAPLGWWAAETPLDRRLAVLSALAFLSLFFLSASWVDWTGGTSFGPRLLVPVLPALAVPIGLFWKRYARRRGPRLVLLALLAVGVGVEICAVVDPFDAFWSTPVLELVGGSFLASMLFLGSAVTVFALGVRSLSPAEASLRGRAGAR